MSVRHASYAELEAALRDVERSPRERGTLEMIVRRPTAGQREVVDSGTLDVAEGLVGDRWARGKRWRMSQLTVINARFVALVAYERERWPLAGDQLYVDFDLSSEHVPPGTRIAVGAASFAKPPFQQQRARFSPQRGDPLLAALTRLTTDAKVSSDGHGRELRAR